MREALRIEPLNEVPKSVLELIHEKSVEILGTLGFQFVSSRRAIDIFKARGFRVDGDVVYFAEGQIDRALETVPSRFRVRALNPDHDFVLGDGGYAFSNCSAPAFLFDSAGGRRLALKSDYINFVKIAHQLDAINLIRPMWDVNEKPEGKFSWIIRWGLEYTDKAISGSSKTDIALVAAAFGLSKQQMRDRAAGGETYLLGVCNPRSPLMLEQGNCDFIISQAEYGVGCKISPVPIAGMTGPITIPGLLILANAEILAPLVLSQLINPGTPVLYGVLSTTTDLQTMVTTAAPPELTGNIMRTGIGMAKMYGIPSRVDIGNTNSCTLDYQAGAETSFMLANAMWSGADLMASLGSLESRGMGSLEKLVVDARFAQAMRAGFDKPDISKLDGPGVQELLESYRKPDILPGSLLKDLDRIVEESEV